jgi:hypothetical protein
MDIQKPIDYIEMFTELLRRRAELTRKRDEAEVELVKVEQLIGAIFRLLPEAKKKSYQATMESIEAEGSGLQDAIKLVFSAHKDEWFTVSNVRDYLIEMGFDFRRYQANPLASIGTTLKRMVPSYLESSTAASGLGGTTFRRRRATLGRE